MRESVFHLPSIEPEKLTLGLLPGNFAGWNPWWTYESNIRQVYQAPHQALPAWIATGLMLDIALASRPRQAVLAILVLTLLWSPFVTLGLVPVILADFLSEPGSLWARLRQYLANASAILAAPVLLLTGVFYASKLEPVMPVLDSGIDANLLLATIGSDKLISFLVGWFAFCLLQVGFWLFIVYLGRATLAAKMKWILGVAVLWLFAMTWFTVGRWNDLNMRGSLPALFVIGVALIQSVYWIFSARARYWPAVAALLVIAALNPMVSIAQHVITIAMRGHLVDFSHAHDRDIATQYLTDAELASQYLSLSDTPFFSIFADSTALATGASVRPTYLFDKRIVLVNYYADAQSVQPGGSVTFHSTLRSIDESAKNYVVVLRLIGEEDRVLWENQGWPAGMPTSQWGATRQHFFDSQVIQVPPDASPGIYRIEMYWTDPETKDKLSVHELTTDSVRATIVPLGYLAVGDVESTPPHPLWKPARFGAAIELRGADLADCTAVDPGENLTMRLFWQAAGKPDGDYTGFVHVVDPGGHLVAQQDHRPLDGLVPTSLWQPGLATADAYTVILPSDSPPGRYSLFVGLYDAQTGQRLSVTQGGEQAGDALKIGELAVGTPCPAP